MRAQVLRVRRRGCGSRRCRPTDVEGAAADDLAGLVVDGDDEFLNVLEVGDELFDDEDAPHGVGVDERGDRAHVAGARAPHVKGHLRWFFPWADLMRTRSRR